jgi:hypothetical protein
MGLRLGTFLALAGAWGLLAAAARAAPHPPRVGERHPDFTLPRIDDGRPVSLSQFRGKKVLLIEFASW